MKARKQLKKTIIQLMEDSLHAQVYNLCKKEDNLTYKVDNLCTKVENLHVNLENSQRKNNC